MGIEIDSIDEIVTDFEVCLGATTITLEDLSLLKPGSFIDLNLPSGSASFVLVNGEPIAKGEIIVFDKLAIRLNKIFDKDDIYYYPRKYFGT
jgi:flagellar motor switch protein FliN/FliY